MRSVNTCGSKTPLLCQKWISERPSGSQQRKCPVLQLQGGNRVPGEDQRVWENFPANRREHRQAAGACQGTRRPALARQQHTVSNISHFRELILHQNLVFCKLWAWMPHHRQRARITHRLGWGCGISTGARGEISFHFCTKAGRFN